MQAPVSPAAELVLRGLSEHGEECVQQVVQEAGAISGYARLSPADTEDLAAHVRAGLGAILVAISEQRSLQEEDLAFLWPHIRRRTAAGVPEGEMMAVVRIFQRVLWDTIVRSADGHEEGREAALILARPLLGYIDVLSDAVNRAYTEADEAIASFASRTRADLMEALLSGAALVPGASLNAARAVGLDADVTHVVIVARQPAAEADPTTLRIAASLLARTTGSAVEPLAVVRDEEVVVVLPARQIDSQTLLDAIEATHRRLLGRGIPLALGASTVHDGLQEIPAAYAEACLALEQVRHAGGTLVLGGLDVLDYLILRAGDRTAWRLVPPAVREFVTDDAEQGGVLSATLLAYVDCDLSVKLAAQRLFVHANTVHYRLAKIEAQTGCAVRKLHDVQLLTTAVQLHRAGN